MNREALIAWIEEAFQYDPHRPDCDSRRWFRRLVKRFDPSYRGGCECGLGRDRLNWRWDVPKMLDAELIAKVDEVLVCADHKSDCLSRGWLLSRGCSCGLTPLRELWGKRCAPYTAAE